MSGVSVVIPCYNCEQYVGQAIESVLRQTHSAREIIVVDDGSTDDSADVVASFGDNVELIQQENRGVSAARNTGLTAAIGEWLMFMDADDLLDPDALDALTSALRSDPSGVAVMGTAVFESEPTSPYKILRCDSTDFFPNIIRGNASFGANHARLVPKELALRVGGFRIGMPIYEDWHFWWRVALTDASLIAVDHVGAFFRQHGSSCLASSDEPRVARGHLWVLQDLCAEMLERSDRLDAHGDVLFWSAWTAYHRAVRNSFPRHDIQPLEQSIQSLVRKNPSPLHGIRFARMVRLFGLRWAERLRNSFLPAADLTLSTNRQPIAATESQTALVGHNSWN